MPNRPARRLFGALGDASENVSQIARNGVVASSAAPRLDPSEGLCHEGGFSACRRKQTAVRRVDETGKRLSVQGNADVKDALSFRMVFCILAIEFVAWPVFTFVSAVD